MRYHMVERSNPPSVILEMANAHGGNLALLKQTVSQFSKLKYPDLGIKFQPFSANTISTPDYEWYRVYTELQKTPDEWKEVFVLAKENFSVWLDIFDSFGIELLRQNQSLITGIKLQSSILCNNEVVSSLKCLDNSELEILINVSGHDLHTVHSIVGQFKALKPKNLALQVGFQSYPTELKDTSLNKIIALKKEFPSCRISMADHLDAKNELSLDIPVWAYVMGSDIIEKHICLDRETAKFDFYSAIEFEQTQSMLHKIEAAMEAVGDDFVTEAEANYLSKTEQLPLAKHKLFRGALISDQEIMYRRTSQSGVTHKRLVELQKQHFILNKDKSAGDSVKESDFRPAKIATIVACRMKSSRLKAKALLDICGETAIQRCLDSCNQLPFSQRTILATSSLKEDEILKAEAQKCKADFWTGDADDVIKRYLSACEHFDIDIVYRVTGDCPLVSKEIAHLLLDSHFNSGADYTSAANAPVGTAVEIYNAAALRRVIELLGEAKHSEYMTWYFKNNPHIFKLNSVTLPLEISQDLRLTLDYEQDLHLFREIFEKLDERKLAPNLENVFKLVKDYPWLKEINKDCALLYRTDKNLIKMLNEETKIQVD